MTFTADEIARQLSQMPGWCHVDGVIRARFTTGSWGPTLMLANAIGYAAEAADHHPDLLLQYASIEVSLSTHSAGGVTDKDFALAHRIDEIVGWSQERGTISR